MPLTPDQNTVLKTHIEASTDPIIVQALIDGTMVVIADWYNGQASPDYFCWRSSMTVSEIRELIDWDEVVSQNTNTLLSFQILTSAESVNPDNASVRQAFASIFSGLGGANSRTALSNAAKRLATEAEKLFAISSGDGSSTTPDSFGFEGDLRHVDVSLALNNG